MHMRESSPFYKCFVFWIGLQLLEVSKYVHLSLKHIKDSKENYRMPLMLKANV
jgi:hypothetical protein